MTGSTAGRPKSNDRVAAAIKTARDKALEIKDSAYSLVKAPEHLTDRQQVRLDLIQARDPQLFRAYSLKESLRLLLKIQDESYGSVYDRTCIFRGGRAGLRHLSGRQSGKT